jgi:hypothetical protein
MSPVKTSACGAGSIFLWMIKVWRRRLKPPCVSRIIQSMPSFPPICVVLAKPPKYCAAELAHLGSPPPRNYARGIWEYFVARE